MKTIYAEAQPGKVVLKEKYYWKQNTVPWAREQKTDYKAYLTSIRMEEAIKLLIQTDAKMYEIGEKVGYNNVRRFVDAFKQIYSMSPMEYRKTFRED